MTAKYRSRATNETVEVEIPISESVVAFTKSDGSKHQLMRSLFDGQYFSTELPKVNADALAALRIQAGGPGNPIGVTIEDPPAWFTEYVKAVMGRLDALEALITAGPASPAPKPSKSA
jgi:hypothetical protein